ncbi:MAG TPA: hypothetical protein VNN07_05080, partial [Candidatus Tectomicrobia bacterium]|nr:hypothetical protein [Candidatus Tectomicrobia bacterium]
MIEQAVSVAGALMILGAYAGNQLGVLDRSRPAYAWLNLIGSVILTVIALRAAQWGFVLLEGTWALLSVPPLLRR